MTIPASISTLCTALRDPVPAESRALWRSNWARLLESLPTPHQMLGRHGNGYGATICAVPRCDSACRGCYLGEEANEIPAQSVEEIKAQMRALRPALGPCGNPLLTGHLIFYPVIENPASEPAHPSHQYQAWRKANPSAARVYDALGFVMMATSPLSCFACWALVVITRMREHVRKPEAAPSAAMVVKMQRRMGAAVYGGAFDRLPFAHR